MPNMGNPEARQPLRLRATWLGRGHHRHPAGFRVSKGSEDKTPRGPY